MRCSKKTFLFFTFAFFLLFLPLTVSCVSRPSSTEDNALNYSSELYIPQSFEWQKVVDGISIYNFENKTMPVLYHAVKVDLQNPKLKIVCYPNKLNTEKFEDSTVKIIKQPFIFNGKKTLSFAKENNCVVAVNASPFCGKNKNFPLETIISRKRQIAGVFIVDKIQYSLPVEKYSALCFTKANGNFTSTIIENQTQDLIKSSDIVLGGFFTVLSNSTIKDFKTISYDSRTGAGISSDGKYLFILVVEGEVKSKSVGLSYPACAEIFKAMGCSDALEFDGGSSSEMCINGKSILSYKQTVIQANSLGFCIE